MTGGFPVTTTPMPIALTPDTVFEYQLIDDRVPDADGKRRDSSAVDPGGTVFLLRPLTPAEEATLQNKQFTWSPSGELQSYNFGTERLTVLEYGLIGWRNFKDANGAEVPFRTRKSGSKTTCDVECLAVLSLRHRNELVAAHKAHFALTEDEGN